MKNKFIFSALLLLICKLASSQTFTVQLIDSLDYGQPAGNDIVTEANIINTGTTQLQIDIIRKENNLPPGWQSYLCADVCLAPFVDSTRLYLDPGASQNFKVSFSTTNVSDTGNCLIRFKNVSNNANSFKQRFHGITSPNAGIKEYHFPDVRIFPNPVVDYLQVSAAEQTKSVFVKDASGRIYTAPLEQSYNGMKVNVSGLPAGLYFLQIITASGSSKKSFLKE
jgi:hypothetical protein